MLPPALVAKVFIFSSAAAAGNCFCWSRRTLAVISDSGRYFEMIFAMSTGHVAKAPSLIYWSRVSFFGQQGI